MLPAAHLYFRYGSQARKLYDRLACGPATATEIVRDLGIYQYHKKIAQLRQSLSGSGVTVKARPINGRRNNWEYRLGRMD